jgi:aspartate aminotransferase
MTALAGDIEASIASASWIRRMFDLATRLIAEHGAANVFDYSIGNPSLEPPTAVLERLSAEADRRDPGLHKYMPSRGYPEVRQRLADWLSKQHGVTFPWPHLLMTCGSASAINTALRALVEPGDGILIMAPWFAEYPFYILHARGTMQTATTTADFDLDPAAIDAAITDRTRVVILNSPNNPTGRMYPDSSIDALIAILRRRNVGRAKPIVLISDDVYRRVVFDGLTVPAVMPKYEHALIASSFSKDLGLAGERIGYLAVHPNFPDAEKVLGGFELCLRTLGFVNAPALFQRVVAAEPEALVDVDVYRRNRDALYAGLTEIGYRVTKPDGTFFMFPDCPIADDEAFARLLVEHRVIAVPGKGFGRPGCLRLSFAVAEEMIPRSLPSFAAAFRAARAG